MTVSGTSYTHTSLDAAKTYYYAVIADGSTGSSPIFEEVSAQLIPGAPTLTVGTNTDTTVTTTWNTVSGANAYRLHSSTSPSVKETDNITIVAGNFHTVSGLTSGDTRYFAMISENSVSQSSGVLFNEVTATAIPLTLGILFATPDPAGKKLT